MLLFALAQVASFALLFGALLAAAAALGATAQ